MASKPLPRLIQLPLLVVVPEPRALLILLLFSILIDTVTTANTRTIIGAVTRLFALLELLAVLTPFMLLVPQVLVRLLV